ncbi:DENN domain-containing protein 1B [Alosa pseudoharengus]|uniref:DENN domain-containing protein 1B n=1 Tax=Alosa pseudoharengus TaxID=34774 RepID=UPI003F8C4C05
MDSRINEKPDRTFDLVLQVACPASENEDPAVLWKFPQDFGDQELQEVLQTVPKFCFPFDVERVSPNQVGQNFTFVLTDIESKQRFGFCRLTSGCRICICLLSYLPWFEIYYKLLNTLADYLTKQQANDLNDMLESLHRLPVPKPNTPVNLSVNEWLHISTGQVANASGSQEPHSYFIAPDINGLPTIPESRNLTEYFVAVDVNNMLQLYASMLHERRIIITSSKLSTLTACVHGAASMLFPMYWQHIYIPVLPPHLLDYCCAPMPYLIGVHLSLLERVKSRSLEDVVILNVDTNTLESPSDDLRNLPSDVVSSLKGKLKKQSTATGSGVARAFLRSQAALFGSYRDALRYKPGEPITFCEESFVNHRSSTMRTFLETAVNAQLFKQFIDGRLAKLNAGRGFSDLFEEEITEGGFCGSNTRSYQQWMVGFSKKGGNLLNSAVFKTKSHVKQGFKEMRSRLKQRPGEDDDGSCGGGSPTSTKSLSPRRLQKRRKNYDSKLAIGCPEYTLDEDEQDSASKISSEDSGEMPSHTEDSDDSYELEADVAPSSGKMTLLEEILDSLSSTSIQQGRLAAAKSLDFLRSMEDLDFKSTVSNTCFTDARPKEPEHELRVSGGGGGGSSGRSAESSGGWLLGQDDSAVHGKHLPPSPRRQPSYRSSMATTTAVPSLRPRAHTDDPATHAPSAHTLSVHASSAAQAPNPRTAPAPPSPAPRTPPSPLTPDALKPPALLQSTPERDPPLSPSPRGGHLSRAASPSRAPEPQSQHTPRGVFRRRVLSKERLKQRDGVRQSAALIPWQRDTADRDGEGDDDPEVMLGGKVQEKGLLEEIDSLCSLSSLNTSLQLTQVHNNTDKS